MIIAFVAHGASNGGAGRVSSIICNGLAKSGHDVTYLAFYYDSIDYPIDDNVQYIKIPKRKNKISNYCHRNFTIQRTINSLQPDIIISFSTNIMLMTSFRWSKKIVYSLRNDPRSVNNGFFSNRIRQLLLKKARAVVFQTPGAKAFFSSRIQKKSVVIGNPIRDGLPLWTEHQHQKRIITACRLDGQKNISMLLKAFAIIYTHFSDYSLAICGEGPLKEQLIREAQDLGISKATEFFGFRNDVDALMAESSIFVLTSNYEGLSNSMLEALAIGIPVISTDSPPGGASLYIKDGINGFLVPVNDHIELSKKMDLLLRNQSICEKFSSKSTTIRKTLSTEMVLSQWEKLLTKD